MLTKELAIAVYDRGRVHPDRLTRQKHGRYLALAGRMLDIYRQGAGKTRRELHRAVHNLFAREADCPARRIDAFLKLLDDMAVYEQDCDGRAADLRRKVFRLAAPWHPLTADGGADEQAKSRIAHALARPWPDIERELFADVPEFQRLQRFDGYPDPGSLLARYNVAQVQVALFNARTLTVWAAQDFKAILRYAKLAGLMHTIRSCGPGQYQFRFDGPASVLRQTRRYGLAMANFLPGLLSCRGWRMHAVLETPRRGWKVRLELRSEDGLRSAVAPPADFDSGVERAFAAAWGTGRRDGWELIREGEVLHKGQKVFVPDFLFRHEDGRQALMEIVGFWTPDYLQAKAKTLQMFAEHRIVLAVANTIATKMGALPLETIYFKSKVRVSDVLERLRGV